MPTQQDVSKHHTHGNLVAAIRGGIESLGNTINSVSVDDLAPVDEHHIGSRQTSEDFLSQLDLTPEKRARRWMRARGSSALLDVRKMRFAVQDTRVT